MQTRGTYIEQFLVLNCVGYQDIREDGIKGRDLKVADVTSWHLDDNDGKRELTEIRLEVAEAWNEWKHEENKDKKATAHLVEELVDLATACMTLADRIEKDSDIPQLVNNTLLMVGAKNYTRGYHNKPMI